MIKDPFPWVPPRTEINIWDAALILAEWRRNVRLWDTLIAKGELRLYEGSKEETKGHFRLQVGLDVTFQRGYSFTAGWDLKLFNRMYRITGGTEKPTTPILCLTAEKGDDYYVARFSNGSVIYQSSTEGVIGIGVWDKDLETLYLYSLKRLGRDHIGCVTIRNIQGANDEVIESMRLFVEKPGELDLF